MKTKSIGFIGGGRITKIFLQGFQNKNIEFPTVIVCDTNQETLQELKKQFPKIETSPSPIAAAKSEVVFIALHPPVIGELISQIKDLISEKTWLISLAPKFNIERLSGMLNTKKILRMIPNATSYINKGYNPICFSSAISPEEKKPMVEVLEALGKTFETEEHKLESYAIASAMLPTYYWFQWMEMQDIGIKMGLTESESADAVYETLKASLELLYHSGLNPDEVKNLIPVKPLAEHETEIKTILNSKLIALFEKIKP